MELSEIHPQNSQNEKEIFSSSSPFSPSSSMITNPLQEISSSTSTSSSNIFTASHPLIQWFHLVSILPNDHSHEGIFDGFLIIPSSALSSSPPSSPPSSSRQQDQVKSILLFQDWIKTWNNFFFHHEGVIYKSSPLLHLFAYNCLHYYTWKYTSILTFYVLLILSIFGIIIGTSIEIFSLLLVSAILNLIIAPLTFKGVYSSPSILSPPVRCHPPPIPNSVRIHPPSSLFSSTLHLLSRIICCFCSNSNSYHHQLQLQRQQQQQQQGHEDEQGINSQVDDLESTTRLLEYQDPVSIYGLYYYLESMTAFLQASSCHSHSFQSTKVIPWLLIISFYFTLCFAGSAGITHSTIFFSRCHGYYFTLHSSTNYCVFTSWQTILLFYDIFAVISLALLSIMYCTYLSLLFYSSHLMISLLSSWQQRYKILRVVKKSTVESELMGHLHEGNMNCEVEKSRANGKDKNNDNDKDKDKERDKKDLPKQTIAQIFPLLERDAHERYLLIHYFAQEISLRWSPFIGCSLVFNALCCVGGYFFLILNYAKDGIIDLVSLIMIVYNAMVILFIVFTIAYANTNVDQLKSHFIQSTEDDYSLIGGRAAWLEYIDQTPVHWTVFGFAITPAWVISLLVTIATGVIGVVGLPFIS